MASTHARGYDRRPEGPSSDCSKEESPCSDCASGLPCANVGVADEVVSLRVPGHHGRSLASDEGSLGAGMTASGRSGDLEVESCAEPSTRRPCPGDSARGHAAAEDLERSQSGRRVGFKLRAMARWLLHRAGHGKRIPVERVAMHRDDTSCWLVANGKVIDATLFLPHHPGGRDLLLKYGGSDCSQDVPLHTLRAQQLWWHRTIGDVAEDPEQQTASAALVAEDGGALGGQGREREGPAASAGKTYGPSRHAAPSPDSLTARLMALGGRGLGLED
jgi:hypothetical protein